MFGVFGKFSAIDFVIQDTEPRFLQSSCGGFSSVSARGGELVVYGEHNGRGTCIRHFNNAQVSFGGRKRKFKVQMEHNE